MVCVVTAHPGPRIVLVSPPAHRPVRAPVRLELRFESAPGAAIDPDSFQVLYKWGFLHHDVTDRIRSFAAITAEGVIGSSSTAIPPGEHTFILRVRDTQRRLGEQTLTFRVVADEPPGRRARAASARRGRPKKAHRRRT